MRGPRTLVALVAAAAVAAAVAGRRVRRYAVAEESMRPALEPGDFLLSVAAERPGPGDTVIFPHPERAGFELVKRVVAVAGQRVSIGGGQVHVNGAPLAERWADGPTFPDGEWEVPPGHVFVLGDQRARSADDSRHLGPVPTAGMWRGVARYWPPGRVGLL